MLPPPIQRANTRSHVWKSWLSLFNVDKNKYIVCGGGDGVNLRMMMIIGRRCVGRALCSGEVGFKIWHLCYLLVVAWTVILILVYIEWYLLKYLCHIRILYVQDLIYLFCSLCSSMLFWRKQIIVSNFVAAPGLRKVTMCGWLRLCFMTCEIIYVKLK